MFKLPKLNFKSVIAIAGAVVVVGVSVMSFTNQTGASQVINNKQNTAEESLSIPGAGMGHVLENYVGATSGSSVELLSTVSLAASNGSHYNEYYDADGNTIGKYIVYTGPEGAAVYDKIPGNERVEGGDKEAAVIAHMYEGDIATLVREQGSWYQIISDSINGYVKKDGFARGVEAEKLDASTYMIAAYANGSESYLYQAVDGENAIVCAVPEPVRCMLLEQEDEVSKIYVPGFGEGWVFNNAFTYETVRKFAVSVGYEEAATKLVAEGVSAGAAAEQARIEKEKAEAEAAAQAEAEAAAQEALTVFDGDVNLDSVSAGGAVAPGTFVVPLNGQLSSGFGWRWGALHKGNDYWCGYGEPIYASCGGVVIEAGWSEWGYGNYVLIQHDDHFVTRYAHMSSLNCTAGQTVSQYDVIGFAGATGDATGIHCHFEILVDGVPYDPNIYLN